MKDIYGLMIYGCRFENQSELENNPYPIRGIGISAIDSYFMISPYCLTPNITPCEEFDTCKFSSLEYGIKAMNSKSKRTLNIQGLKFEKNLLAISLSGLENVSVLTNIFKYPTKLSIIPPGRFTGGLFMEGCTGFHVENNDFNAFHAFMQHGVISPCYGIGVKNSGDDNNEIYNNYFKQLNVGIFAIGENRGRESGLCLKCNELDSNFNDFIVVEEYFPPMGTYQGINRFQGNPNDSTSFSAPAGNTFTWFPPDSVANPIQILNYNYLNDGEDLWYFHHQTQIDPLTYPLDSNYTRETIELKERTLLGFDKERACPSSLGGGGGLKSYSSPRSTIIDADIQLDLLKTQLNVLIDGGNTATLNFEIMTSLPDEGLEIRQELLSTSPYLSDTVLKQAIYKEDVLPNAMIRDVLEANPQSAKSDDILSTLDSRYEPMPDYMMAQILQGEKYLGAREFFEARIQSWNQIRSKAKADLMREFLLDTNMISPLDSVITFLENETDLDSKYDLALAQWNNSDMIGALLTLNSIPSQFVLSEPQNINHENYLVYFEILQTLEDSNWQANQMDSISVSMLFDLKESGNSQLNSLARGLLVNGGFYKYTETTNFPYFTKSSRILPDQNKEDLITTKEERLRLFPNPAGDYVIVSYSFDLTYKYGEIRLIDLKGNELRNYYIKSGKDQIVIDLKAYPNGFYMISLNFKNQVLESKILSKGGH
jgi:hypothetical protein